MDEREEQRLDVGPELYNLKDRLEKDYKNLAVSSSMNLNTLIYYFEKFLDSHRKYEETKLDLLKLNNKLTELEGAENEHN